MLFTLKQLEQFPNLIFNNTLIQFVKDHKHLRLMSSNNGQWHKHIENILTNEEIKVYFNKGRPKPDIHFFFFFFFFFFVLPILEYSSMVWNGCSQQDLIALDRLQNEAARILTGLTR